MKRRSPTVPKEMQDKSDEITKIIGVFCKEHLNEEYELVCFQLCAALCRKCPSALVSRRAATWACGIVHAIGTVNGFHMDSWYAPREIQEEAFERGLIPYLPK